MKIVVNHLTRMHGGRICVAGVDTETDRHVRPIPMAGDLMLSAYAANGGPFGLASVVELGKVLHLAKRPHMEDHRFHLEQAHVTAAAKPEAFWALLSRHAKPRLSEVFGPRLTPYGDKSCIVPRGKGSVSLGCIIPAAPPKLWIKRRPEKRDQVRMNLSDGRFDLDLGVTDIRLYQDDCAAVDEAAVSRLADALRRDDIILCVGLTRLYAATPEQEPVHWLQVNNIHLRNRLTW